MPATTGVGFIEMRIAKVVGFGPPLAEEPSHCVVLDEVSGDRHLVIFIGEREAFSLAARLQGLEFGRPMTYDFAAALVRDLGGRVRQVRVDRLAEGVYAATVEVQGPLGAQWVDARPSDALNLAAITGARVFAGRELVDDFERLQDDDSAQARLLRLALTVPNMRIMKATEHDLPAGTPRCSLLRGYTAVPGAVAAERPAIGPASPSQPGLRNGSRARTTVR